MPYSFCFFSARYLPDIGGVENYTLQLVSELVRRGHRVIIVTSQIPGTPDHEVVDGVDIRRVPAWRLLDGRLPVSHEDRTFKGVFEQLTTEHIDLAVTNTRFYRLSYEAACFCDEHDIPALVIDHGSAHLVLGGRFLTWVVERYEHQVTRMVKRHVTHFYGVSQGSCRWLAHFGIAADGVLSNAIDADSFCALSSGRDFRSELDIPEDHLLCSFIGRIIPEKGVVELQKAARMLEDEKVEFLIAGEGYLLDDLRSNAPANMHYLGALGRDDVSALYAGSDLFCLPSRSEGFCSALLEAASWNVPPVITHVGGTDELVPDATYGIILEDNSVHAIVDGVTRMCKYGPYRETAGRKIGELVRSRYAWSNTADDLEHIVEYGFPTEHKFNS